MIPFLSWPNVIRIKYKSKLPDYRFKICDGINVILLNCNRIIDQKSIRYH